MRREAFRVQEEMGCTTLQVWHLMRLMFVEVMSVICFAHLVQDNHVLKVSAR